MKIIDQFTQFFQDHQHSIVSSSSLIPEGDNSVLLTTAGMQQFKPYYLGKPSLFGNRVASIQKCIRVDDIEEVGDETHATFFEMLGNFSFNYPSGEGSYFKSEAIRIGYEFITEKLNLKIDYVTIFGGDDEVPRDSESYEIWKSLADEKGIELEIREYDRADNFWGPTGSEGPCGPTTEIYVGGVEIWNIVFNQFYRHVDKTLTPLESQGVDTGGGFERILTQVEKVASMYDCSVFAGIMANIRGQFPHKSESMYRVILDHIRASLFLVADGVIPSNKEQGYVLRRLIRRVFSIIESDTEGVENWMLIANQIRGVYQDRYTELSTSQNLYTQLIQDEFLMFNDALKRGIIHANKILKKKRIPQMSGEEAFLLSSTYGLSPEVMKLRGLDFDSEEFERKQQEHKEVSRAGASKKFGGHGLILDNGELKAADERELQIVTRLHSATHLLHTALRTVLGTSVIQKGSDITAERTRFDFSFDRKLTNEEKLQIEQLVNSYIEQALPVTITEMSLSEAKKTGALYLPKRNYPKQVQVYAFGDVSKELCGGPHVANTQEIGRFTLKKEEAVARGIRRIRGVISD